MAKYKSSDFTILSGEKTGDSRIAYVFNSKDGRVRANLFWQPRDVQLRGLIGETGTIHIGFPFAGGRGPPPTHYRFLLPLINRLNAGEYEGSSSSINNHGGEKTMAGHKGHKTKRGLSQDQKRKSQEPHEKDYRKSKRKKAKKKAARKKQRKAQKVGTTRIGRRKINGVRRKVRITRVTRKKTTVRVFKKKARKKSRKKR